MPRIDFSNVDDVQDYSPLPAGRYLVTLTEVEEATTKYGDEMWKLRFVVDEGQCKGRYIFDNLVLSKAAQKRVKFICSRLGFDVSGVLDLTPDLIKGSRCFVSVEVEEYTDQEGETRNRNRVPFAGYEQFDDANQDDDSHSPF